MWEQKSCAGGCVVRKSGYLCGSEGSSSTCCWFKKQNISVAGFGFLISLHEYRVFYKLDYTCVEYVVLLHAEIHHCTAIPWGLVLSLQQQSCSYRAAHSPVLFDGVRMAFSASQSCRDFSCLVYPPSSVFLAGCAGEREVLTYFCLCWGWPQSLLQVGVDGMGVTPHPPTAGNRGVIQLSIPAQ